MAKKADAGAVVRQPNKYSAIIAKIFADRYSDGMRIVPFVRTDLEETAAVLSVTLPKNLGDLIYSFRYRNDLPESIIATQPEGMEWIIKPDGRAKYKFCLVRVNRIVPNPDLVTVKIPDATPEIISAYALGDEQAVLARIRYNRLIDIFLGISCYSLQNHLRTTVAEMGQIEIDELYVGIDRHGRQFVIPVQAKGGKDQLSVVQTTQDLAFCGQKFPTLICRAISAQFMADDVIAIFELTVEDDQVRVVEEKHYRLVAFGEISGPELLLYSNRA